MGVEGKRDIKKFNCKMKIAMLMAHRAGGLPPIPTKSRQRKGPIVLADAVNSMRGKLLTSLCAGTAKEGKRKETKSAENTNRSRVAPSARDKPKIRCKTLATISRHTFESVCQRRVGGFLRNPHQYTHQPWRVGPRTVSVGGAGLKSSIRRCRGARESVGDN